MSSMVSEIPVEGCVICRTQSICPVCLNRLEAKRVEYEDGVYLEKHCREHGFFRTILWRGRPDYGSWRREKLPNHPRHPFTQVERGCPYDCGLCAEHRQEPCCVLLEVTSRCDLDCPVCFASSGEKDATDVPLSTISLWYERMLKAGGPFNIQLSGGEPCVRDDLAQIIAMGKKAGFSYFQLNTNGLRIARERDYLASLKEAGLGVVYLQFDGTTDDIYRTIRGREILDAKKKVILNCRALELGVVLVPTVVPGVNDKDLGNIVRFALENYPVVRGIHFQPISYFGRFPDQPRNEDRITIPEILRNLQEQTEGLVKTEDFHPKGSENSYCSFHCTYILMPGGKLLAVKNQAGKTCGCREPEDSSKALLRTRSFVARNWIYPTPSAPCSCGESASMGEWDVILERSKTHLFSVSGMAFQDAWNLDLDLLQDCCINVAADDGKLIPFCAYNLTNTLGEGLYRL